MPYSLLSTPYSLGDQANVLVAAIFEFGWDQVAFVSSSSSFYSTTSWNMTNPSLYAGYTAGMNRVRIAGQVIMVERATESSLIRDRVMQLEKASGAAVWIVWAWWWDGGGLHRGCINFLWGPPIEILT